MTDNPILLDFSNCNYLGDIHAVLKAGFGLPDYYGQGWDALWDCLGYFTDQPLRVEITGLRRLPPELSAQIESMLEVFSRVVETCPNMDFAVIS